MMFAMFMWGVGVGLLPVAPSFASWSMIPLLKIPVCALTFYIVMLCMVHRIWCTMAERSSSLGWLCWGEGFRM